jgi:hypothetical protein
MKYLLSLKATLNEMKSIQEKKKVRKTGIDHKRNCFFSKFFGSMPFREVWVFFILKKNK